MCVCVQTSSTYYDSVTTSATYAQMVQFLGGVYESNEPWGFILDSPLLATREVTISGIYAEGNGQHAAVGGTFYIGHAVTSVKVENSWLAASGSCACINQVSSVVACLNAWMGD